MWWSVGHGSNVASRRQRTANSYLFGFSVIIPNSWYVGFLEAGGGLESDGEVWLEGAAVGDCVAGVGVDVGVDVDVADVSGSLDTLLLLDKAVDSSCGDLFDALSVVSSSLFSSEKSALLFS